MSATTLTAPIRANTTGAHTRPGLGRLVAVELRKTVNTRAGFWLQVATVAITALVVTVRSVVGDAADQTFAAVLTSGFSPRPCSFRSPGSCSSPRNGPSAPG